MKTFTRIMFTVLLVLFADSVLISQTAKLQIQSGYGKMFKNIPISSFILFEEDNPEVIKNLQAEEKSKIDTSFNKLPRFYADEGIKLTAEERYARYSKLTGSQNTTMMNLFSAADADTSNDLSFEELETFQSWLWSKYTYQTNPVALNPELFFYFGGGDCEDWALVTAAFLEYWGWESYLITLVFGENMDIYHGVCMVRPPKDIPSRYEQWIFKNEKTRQGVRITAGTYILIDYYYVGKLTNAVEHYWQFYDIDVPRRVYGEIM